MSRPTRRPAAKVCGHVSDLGLWHTDPACQAASWHLMRARALTLVALARDLAAASSGPRQACAYAPVLTAPGEHTSAAGWHCLSCRADNAHLWGFGQPAHTAATATPPKGTTPMSVSLKRTAAAVTALLIAVAAAGLATAALASAATTPIDVAGISGATIVADGTTGYTLTVPGLTPDVPYQGAVDTHDTTWRYEASATSDGAGTGTFVFTFAAPPAAGTTVYVTAQPLGRAPNFSATVTFPALNDTTPVVVVGHTGVTITGTSGGTSWSSPA